ncbi:uncharacterized protein N7483_009224 [Penicillium malachiteum]|uniref:uncharacterized protein n=1 Tax=Penicillium malachiteum TaxID=1324776 RepID=UPI002548039D|nr:uncharacterized protein N7483_009224 [Penicillium malachiteum]KAJ5721290.1 hypothetical protein N7483_009224 [Penicillium malachiteum]
MTLSDSAIIVIVLVGCLAVTALGAALFRHRTPLEEEARSMNQTHEQSKYMRAVRMMNFGHLKRESLSAAKDMESRYTSEEASNYGNYYPQPHEASTPSTNMG